MGQNVAYGLNNKREGRDAFRHRVDEMLALVGLPGTENKYPAQLSGGQQQRIALARALATRPDLLFLDEPLSALDAIERVRLRTEIRKLQQRLGVTTVMVTHDQEEALSMADRIVVMRNGCIQQIGDPHAIYHRPANDFVADFIGRGNLIQGQATATDSIEHHGMSLQCAAALQPGQTYRFYLRPEDISLLDPLDTTGNSLLATVDKQEFLGAFTLVTLNPLQTGMPALVAQFSSNYLAGRPIEVGARVRIGLPRERLHPMQEAA